MSLLKKRITQEGRKQSQLAAAIAERTGDSAATIEARLSAIGSPDGDSYFFTADKAPSRLSALSSELGIDEAELRALRDAPTLVIDPRLPADARAYVLEKAGSTYDAVVVEEGGADLWQRLRDKAQSERRAIVVASDLRESRPYYSGASVDHSELVRVPRGFRLESHPELIPVPPRPPAPTHTREGVPLIRGAALKNWVGHRWPHALEAREREANQRDEELVFTLDELEEVSRRHYEYFLPGLKLKDGVFWCEEVPDGLVRALEPHPVKSWTAELSAQLKDRNPFRLPDLAAEFGNEGKHFVDRWRSTEKAMWETRAPAVPVLPASQMAELTARFRTCITELQERGVAAGSHQCEHAAGYWRCDCNVGPLYFPHVLKALQQSDLVVADLDGLLTGSADLGAGRVGIFKLARYAREQPVTLGLVRAHVGEGSSEYLVDGGDVLLSLRVLLVPALLGRTGPAIASAT